MIYPKISIVTACYNFGHYIEETINSIVGQNYPNLEYIIIDGGSTDNTLDIIKKYEKQISYWISEKDNGVGDAVNKGFKVATGQIMGCINADDLLHRKSLFTIAEIFSTFEIDWLTGASTVIDEQGRTVYVAQSRSFTKYDFIMNDFKWIQLESTFWSSKLYRQAGGYLDSELKYAGDFELWIRFFHISKLQVTDALIGAFRMRSSNQLSTDNMDKYIVEVEKVQSRQKWDAITLKTLVRIKTLRRFNYFLRKSRFLNNDVILARTLSFEKKLLDALPKLYYDFKGKRFLK